MKVKKRIELDAGESASRFPRDKHRPRVEILGEENGCSDSDSPGFDRTSLFDLEHEVFSAIYWLYVKHCVKGLPRMSSATQKPGTSALLECIHVGATSGFTHSKLKSQHMALVFFLGSNPLTRPALQLKNNHGTLVQEGSLGFSTANGQLRPRIPEKLDGQLAECFWCKISVKSL